MATERWMFTSSQLLEGNPSKSDGYDAERELLQRQQGSLFIQDMGQRLEVNQLCISTAIVYMHRFYTVQSFGKFHRNTMAPVCLFLAAKVEEQPRKLEHIIKVAHYYLNKDQHGHHQGSSSIDVKSEAYAKKADEIITNENVLLQTLGFTLRVRHPHSDVVQTCSLVRASKDLAQTSYLMATNMLQLTTFCLQYSAKTLACFCIHLACKWSHWEIPRSTEGKEWYHYVDKSVTLHMMEDLAKQFSDIYKKTPAHILQRAMSWKNQKSKSVVPPSVHAGDVSPPAHAASASGRHPDHEHRHATVVGASSSSSHHRRQHQHHHDGGPAPAAGDHRRTNHERMTSAASTGHPHPIAAAASIPHPAAGITSLKSEPVLVKREIHVSPSSQQQQQQLPDSLVPSSLSPESADRMPVGVPAARGMPVRTVDQPPPSKKAAVSYKDYIKERLQTRPDAEIPSGESSLKREDRLLKLNDIEALDDDSGQLEPSSPNPAADNPEFKRGYSDESQLPEAYRHHHRRKNSSHRKRSAGESGSAHKHEKHRRHHRHHSSSKHKSKHRSSKHSRGVQPGETMAASFDHYLDLDAAGNPMGMIHQQPIEGYNGDIGAGSFPSSEDSGLSSQNEESKLHPEPLEDHVFRRSVDTAKQHRYEPPPPPPPPPFPHHSTSHSLKRPHPDQDLPRSSAVSSGTAHHRSTDALKQVAPRTIDYNHGKRSEGPGSGLHNATAAPSHRSRDNPPSTATGAVEQLQHNHHHLQPPARLLPSASVPSFAALAGREASRHVDGSSTTRPSSHQHRGSGAAGSHHSRSHHHHQHHRSKASTDRPLPPGGVSAEMPNDSAAVTRKSTEVQGLNALQAQLSHLIKVQSSSLKQQQIGRQPPPLPPTDSTTQPPLPPPDVEQPPPPPQPPLPPANVAPPLPNEPQPPLPP